MRLEKIIALIEKAGFKFTIEGKGCGLFEGHQISHFEKGANRNPQLIQLALLDAKKDIVGVTFSINVPVKLRDEVYAIMNEPTATVENKFGM